MVRQRLAKLLATKRLRRSAEELAAPLAAQTLAATQFDKYHSKNGHGYAAEDAHHRRDILRGRWPQFVGASNEKNGADRIVGGVGIQTKYHDTAQSTVQAAFDRDTGLYRYKENVLEVPKDQYDDAVRRMRDRIGRGLVPGTRNPADAEKMVKKGAFTFQQAKNIARAGNIDSLRYDAETQVLSSGASFWISSLITLAQETMRGSSTDDSLKSAGKSGLRSAGNAFASGVVSSQILRTQVGTFGAGTVKNGVKTVAKNKVGGEIVKRVATGSLGRSVHGAAATSHVAKLARTNPLTATVTVVVTSIPDACRYAGNRSISGTQLVRNVSVNTAGVGGGTAGWLAGAALGATLGSAVPGPGTALGGMIGGVVGGLSGGLGGSLGAKKVADLVVEDDATRLLKVVSEEVDALIIEYMVTEDEFEHIQKEVTKALSPGWFRKLFKTTDRGNDHSAIRRMARGELECYFLEVVRRRSKRVRAVRCVSELSLWERYTQGSYSPTAGASN